MTKYRIVPYGNYLWRVQYKKFIFWQYIKEDYSSEFIKNFTSVNDAKSAINRLVNKELRLQKKNIIYYP